MVRLVVIASVLALAACGSSSTARNGETPTPEFAFAEKESVKAALLEKTECQAAPATIGKWNHRRSRLTTSLGSARHGTADVISSANRGFTVEGRFQYGKSLKDLEDEPVEVWLSDPVDCSWKNVGSAVTDRDGFIALELEASHAFGANGAVFEIVVRGDGTRARGTLWILAPDTQVVVFDIDGTLTDGDSELVEELLSGKTPTESPGALSVVRAYADAGVLPIYLTGRPMTLQNRSRAWLDALGFPSGPLGLTRGFRVGIAHVEEFKQRNLSRLRDELKLKIVAAYGNAATDVCAYAKAGIAVESTYIVGQNKGTACAGFAATVPVDDYREHLAIVQSDLSR